jgi:hypothetical protein
MVAMLKVLLLRHALCWPQPFSTQGIHLSSAARITLLPLPNPQSNQPPYLGTTLRRQWTS